MRSRPSRRILMVSALVALLVLALSVTPVAPLFGFTALPPWMILAIAAICLSYQEAPDRSLAGL